MKDENFILTIEEQRSLDRMYIDGIKREAEENGKKIGKKNALIETAKKMLKDKLDLDTIIKYTGLSKKQIKKLEI